LPAKKTPLNVASLARAYTGVAVRCLAGAVENPPPGTPLSTSIQAAQILLDRGWGRPHQTVNAEVAGAIEVIIRKSFDGKKKD
jgi:hypothetical protein